MRRPRRGNPGAPDPFTIISDDPVPPDDQGVCALRAGPPLATSSHKFKTASVPPSCEMSIVVIREIIVFYNDPTLPTLLTVMVDIVTSHDVAVIYPNAVTMCHLVVLYNPAWRINLPPKLWL